MIKVISVIDSSARWDDYMAVNAACAAASLPEPVEECYTIGPQTGDWRGTHAVDVIAAYLQTHHALVEIDGSIYDLDEALAKIKERHNGRLGGTARPNHDIDR